MSRLGLTAIAVIVALALASAPDAAATISPKNCGTATVKGKRYRIRTHLIPCARGRPWAIAYLTRRTVPSGYRCRRYDREVTRVAFTCFRGQRDFLAIRT